MSVMPIASLTGPKVSSFLPLPPNAWYSGVNCSLLSFYTRLQQLRLALGDSAWDMGNYDSSPVIGPGGRSSISDTCQRDTQTAAPRAYHEPFITRRGHFLGPVVL